jgi:hypothetical protein
MRALRRIAVLLLSLGIVSPVRADEPNLDIELWADRYHAKPDPEPVPEGAPAFQGWATVAPRWSVGSGRVVFSMRALLEADTHREISRTHLYDDEDRELRRSILRFEELSLKLDFGAVDLELGRQQLAWGRTDVVSPTDNLTPRDWIDPLDEQRLSPWALRANFEKSRWNAELVAIPRFTPSRLPLLGGRWFDTGQTSIANPLYPSMGKRRLELVYDWDATVPFPPTTWSNVQEAVRGGRRGERIEWSLSYFRGFDDAPYVAARHKTPQFNQGILPIVLTKRFARLDVAGGDLVILAGRWAFRGEAGYFHFPDGLGDGYLLYDLEAEWTRGNWSVIAGGADSVAGEGGGSVFTDPAASIQTFIRTGSVGSGAPVSLDQVFLPAGFLRIARAAATEWDASLEAMVGLKQGDHLIRAEASWPLTDRVRAGGEADLLNGPRDTLFGSWRSNDRLRVFLRIAL